MSITTLCFHIHAGWEVLDIPTRIPIHVRIELHCKYGEATWGSKITKTLKLDLINKQHSQRDSELCRQTCYPVDCRFQVPAVWNVLKTNVTVYDFLFL